MQLSVHNVKCWKCLEVNRVLILPGPGAYHCDRCDAVIIETRAVEIRPEGRSGRLSSELCQSGDAVRL